MRNTLNEGTKEFILEEYEKQIQERGGTAEKNKDTILEAVHHNLEDPDKDLDDLYQLADQHVQDWNLNLVDVMRFAENANDGDLVQTSDQKKVTQTLTEGKKQALKVQIGAQDGKENLVYTDEAMSNEDRRELTEEVWREQEKAAFIISKQHSFQGRIALRLSRTKERFNLTNVFAEKGDNPDTIVKHFAESASKTKGLAEILKHTHAFYQYKFISEDDEEYIVLSDQKLEPQRCTVHGTKINIGDYKTMGENRKMAVDQEIIFMHSAEPAIKPLSDEDLREYQEEITHDHLARKVFGDFQHPEWYERMMLAVLFVKDDNGYPSHVMQKAQPGTAKSTILEGLCIATDENNKPFTGTSSTIKGLVPSFSENPPDEGYLMRCNRVAAVDEKFNLLSNTIQKGNSRMKDAFRPMLDLLEHSSREFSSGNGSISGKTEATMFAMGNPSYGIKTIHDAIENDKIDEAYLSRFLLYEMLDSHIDYINQRKGDFASGNDQEYMPETDDRFVSLLDTMRMKHVSGIDHDRVSKKHDQLLELVPNVFRNTFKARYQHHLLNLVCGVTKINYLVDDREVLEPGEKDYEQAFEIMETLISSWGEIDMTEISYKSRVNALNHSQRKKWQEIQDDPGLSAKTLVDRVETDNLARDMTQLRRMNLVEITEDEEGVKHYHPWWTDTAENIRVSRQMDEE